MDTPNGRRCSAGTAPRAYHSFEAPHSLALVQGDARDGIWLDLPDGSRKKTYLFVWIDDFSRKILFGKYYLDEKLPCLEDSFRYMVLRWGIPLAVYLDNGAVYISRQFRLRAGGAAHQAASPQTLPSLSRRERSRRSRRPSRTSSRARPRGRASGPWRS